MAGTRTSIEFGNFITRVSGFNLHLTIDSICHYAKTADVSEKKGVGVSKTDCRLHMETVSDPARCSIVLHGFLSEKSIMSQTRLFVGNLAYQTMENDLQDYFSQAGVVTSVNLMLDKFTGKSRGFAFVEYSSSDEANKAVEMFHSK